MIAVEKYENFRFKSEVLFIGNKTLPSLLSEQKFRKK